MIEAMLVLIGAAIGFIIGLIVATVEDYRETKDYVEMAQKTTRELYACRARIARAAAVLKGEEKK